MLKKEKSGFLSIQKETLETHLCKVFTDPQTDVVLSDFSECNKPYLSKVEFDSSAIKLYEVKDVCQQQKLLYVNCLLYKVCKMPYSSMTYLEAFALI